MLTSADIEQEDIEPTKQIKQSPSDSGTFIEIERFSSYQKLLRVVSYVLRFIGNCRKSKADREVGPLHVNEIQIASKVLIRSVQQEDYKEEMCDIKSKKQSRIPIVRQLRLYVDENELLRSGGRIDNAAICETAKYPYLLPSNHQLTTLVIMDAHIRQNHAGLNGTIVFIRQTFLIPQIRQRVKMVLRSCVSCRKVMGKPYVAPDPPPLPKDRLLDDQPFAVTGVDFTGALHVKTINKTDTKVYLCLFTCATTRAVHIEIVPDLTEHSFLLAFRRFASRRSLPRIMISDNASTYKSAASKISELFKTDTVHTKLGNYGTIWKFIPARAPWYGGWWERLIGLTKDSLKKTLGRAHIDIDTLNTIVTEIECTLNDRPLTCVSTDSQDPEPLSPSHLLYGRKLKTLPYPSTAQKSDIRKPLSNAQVIKKTLHQRELLEHFQTRWKKGYLTSLRDFQRAYGNNQQVIRVGDVVQIHEHSPRTLLNVGIVMDLVRGGDGLTSSAMVRTKYGLSNRPIVKLYPLEVTASEELRVPRRSTRLQSLI